MNETLLDIEALRPFFTKRFGDGGVLRQWFAEQILYSQALTIAGAYAPFGALAAASLRMIGDVRGVQLGDDAIDEFRAAMAALPAHDDVDGALTALSDAGFRMVALTNSAPEAARAGLAHAGIARFFESVYSVDEVDRFKPAPETYALVADHLGAELSDLRLIACHAWDTLGARAAGCAAALVTRPGNAPLPLGPQPDIVAPTLTELARRVAASDA